jgi:hypothetical protein
VVQPRRGPSKNYSRTHLAESLPCIQHSTLMLSSFFSLSRGAEQTMPMQMRRAFFPLICKQSTHTESVYVHDLWRFNVSITDIRQCARRCDFLLRALSFCIFATHLGGVALRLHANECSILAGRIFHRITIGMWNLVHWMYFVWTSCWPINQDAKIVMKSIGSQLLIPSKYLQTSLTKKSHHV